MMRKFTLSALLLVLVLPLASFAQNKKGKTKMISPEQKSKIATYQPKFDQLNDFEDQSMLQARPITQEVAPVQYTGKVSALANPIELGRATNAFTILAEGQNQVVANEDLNLVAFIHRHDVTVWGGGGTENGKYRYDLSMDGGLTFSADIGPMQSLYTNFGRYPQMIVSNPDGNTDPTNARFIYYGPTNHFPTPGWVGHVSGASEISTTNPVNTTETYNFDTENTLLPYGLCNGLDNEYWTAEIQYDGANAMDSIRVLKGTWNSTSNDVDWVVYAKLDPSYDKSADGDIHVVGPNMAFSPDGMTGYIGFLSNLTSGTNANPATYLPCFFKTTDGGGTWGDAVEIDLDTIPWIADSLMTLWVDIDSVTGDTIPASSGMATTAFEFDMTVDRNGNLHIFTVVGTHGDTDPFSISSGLAKFASDIWTPDGGATFEAKYISPVLCFRGDFGTGDPISQDHYPQISRDEIGSRIFYSWADTDTALVTGNQNGIGFGEVDQLAPNLRIAASRVSDNYQTCPKLLTDDDFIWGGRALMPTMAPTILNADGTYKMPIVMLEMITNNPIESCKFWYVGEDATFTDADFKHPHSLLLTWDNILGGCPLVGVENSMESDIVLHQSFPNPATNRASIRFELPSSMNVSLDLVNMYGQEVATITAGEFASGSHKIEVNTSELAAGVYFYNLRTNEKVITKKMIISK